MLRRDLLFIKSFIFFYKANYKEAEELAQHSLELTKERKIGKKLHLGRIYNLLGWINVNQGNQIKALKFAKRSLELNKELNYGSAISECYCLMVAIYIRDGEYDQALQYCKQVLSLKESTARSKLDILRELGVINSLKSRLKRALKYRQQAVELATKLPYTDLLIGSLNDLGSTYRIMGKHNLAVESFERALILSEKWNFIGSMARSLSLLIKTYIEESSREIANRYFSRLTGLYNQTKNEGNIDISIFFLISKAYMMKTSTRMGDRADAQKLYKELANNASGNFLISCMGNLCDLLLEELSLYNDPEILDEIMPLITKSLEMAETEHNYFWLAEAKLLQAKLALIQMNFEEARRLLVEAQRIAELHGLELLAQEVSMEHDKQLEQIDVWRLFDKLLEQIDVWEKNDIDKIPIGDRLKLASTEGVLERLQGKRGVEVPELVDEESILLLIIAEGGILIFSYPFSEEWKFDDELFGSFLTAFNSISDEIFSEGLDRVKFGNQTVLIEQVADFSICYLFKGQTYIAQKKFNKFVEEVQNNSSLWKSFEQHFRANQVLELKNSPPLESLITEIFLRK
jgi:tetratricopeptide (TPR) repeat protein